MIWARMFFEAQSITQNEGTFYQDNMSTIIFEKNGWNSCGSKSKHINNWYFWIKDCLKSDNIKVVHCPTTAMLADFLTKPLQGSLFQNFMDVMLGYRHFLALINELELSTSKERVGEGDILEDNRSKNYNIPMKNGNKFLGKIQGVRHNGQQADVGNDNEHRGNKMMYAQILMKM